MSEWNNDLIIKILTMYNIIFIANKKWHPANLPLNINGKSSINDEYRGMSSKDLSVVNTDLACI